MTPKPSRIKGTKRGITRSLVRRGAESRKVAPPSKKLGAPPDPAVCTRCGAVYRRKTWRAGERALMTSLQGVSWTVCPACRQEREGTYFGRVTLRGTFPPAQEAEIRRRIERIAARAQFTQPERRVASVERSRSALRILTTSQKLAHRIAREMIKLYGGDATYSWDDRDGALDATWVPETAPTGSRRAPTRRPRS